MPNHVHALVSYIPTHSSYLSASAYKYSTKKNLSGEEPYSTQTLSKKFFLKNKNMLPLKKNLEK